MKKKTILLFAGSVCLIVLLIVGAAAGRTLYRAYIEPQNTSYSHLNPLMGAIFQLDPDSIEKIEINVGEGSCSVGPSTHRGYKIVEEEDIARFVDYLNSFRFRKWDTTGPGQHASCTVTLWFKECLPEKERGRFDAAWNAKTVSIWFGEESSHLSLDMGMYTAENEYVQELIDLREELLYGDPPDYYNGYRPEGGPWPPNA